MTVFIVEFLGGFCTDGSNQFIGKFLAFDIDDVGFRTAFFDFAGNSVQKMCLSKAGPAVNKQRVIGIARVLSNCAAGCLRKFVGASYNKGGEGVFIFATLAVHIDFFLTVRGEDWRGGRGLNGSRSKVLSLSFFGSFTEDLYFDRKTNHCFKGLMKQSQVFFLHNFFHKLRFDIENSGVSIKTDRFQTFDPYLISNFR